MFLDKEQLTFVTPNPRFAGSSFDPADPTPYGVDTLQGMADSMIEFYKAHGTLLLQPVSVVKHEDKYEVRAGYTRAMAFVTMYDYIAKEVGQDVMLSATVYESLSETDSLMENMMRREQSFVATAFAIGKAMEGKNAAQVARQLGMTVQRVKHLVFITAMPVAFVEKCYMGDIKEEAAVYLAKLTPLELEFLCRFVHTINEKRQDEDGDDPDSYRDSLFGPLVTEKDAMYFVNCCIHPIEKQTPIEAFKDHLGKQHPHIKEETWCLDRGTGMFTDELFCLNPEAQKERMRLYWETVAATCKVHPHDNAVYSLFQVPIGTHPNEKLYWDECWKEGDFEPAQHVSWFYRGQYLKAYITQSERQETTRNAKMITEFEMNAAKDKNNRASVALLDKAKKELQQTIILEVWNDEGSDKEEFLKTIIENYYFDSNRLKTLSILTGETVDENTSIFDLVKKYGIELLGAMRMYDNLENVKYLFKDNSVDFDGRWNKIKKDLNDQKAALIKEGEQKAQAIQEKYEDTKHTFESLHDTMVMDKPMTLFQYLMGQPKEAIVKYYSKELGIKYDAKASYSLTVMRFQNALVAKMNSYGVETNPAGSDELAFWIRFHEVVAQAKDQFERIYVENDTAKMQNADVMDWFKDFVEALREEELVEDMHEDKMHSFNLSAVINSGSVADNKFNAMMEQAIVWLHDRGEIYFPVIFLTDKGKVRILG